MTWTVIRRLATLAIAVPVLLLSTLGAARLVGFRTQVIVTGSMEPAVSRGSVVLMRPLAAEAVRPGTVVLIPRRDRDGRRLAPVLHRVVSVTRADGVTSAATKGDANPAADPDPYIVGPRTMTPVFDVPHLGYAFAALRTPIGWVLLGILPALAHAVLALRRIWSADEPELVLAAADG